MKGSKRAELKIQLTQVDSKLKTTLRLGPTGPPISLTKPEHHHIPSHQCIIQAVTTPRMVNAVTLSTSPREKYYERKIHAQLSLITTML